MLCTQLFVQFKHLDFIWITAIIVGLVYVCLLNHSPKPCHFPFQKPPMVFHPPIGRLPAHHFLDSSLRRTGFCTSFSRKLLLSQLKCFFFLLCCPKNSAINISLWYLLILPWVELFICFISCNSWVLWVPEMWIIYLSSIQRTECSINICSMNDWTPVWFKIHFVFLCCCCFFFL